MEHHDNKKRNAKLWKSVKQGDIVAAGDRKVVVIDPTYTVTTFRGRNRFPGSFVGYLFDDDNKRNFRFLKSKFTPISEANPL